MDEFDLIVIGAGPAGLSAARMAAQMGCKTLLVEKQTKAGELEHPCSGAISPVPGFVQGFRKEDGLHFPIIDLDIPDSMIIGTPKIQRYLSPGGYCFEAVFPNRDHFPIAVIDKAALLRQLAEQAAQAGAELRFGTTVTGLLRENRRFVGIKTRHGEFRSKVLISAEGVSRRFTEEAGLYEDSVSPKRYAFIVSETLAAPAAGLAEVGQLNTLGGHYTSAPVPIFSTVVIPSPGRAEAYLSLFTDQPQIHTDESLWFYLQEYKQNDPRVNHLLADSKILHRSGTRMVLRKIPHRIVVDGFMGVGDSVGPGGHVGILTCIYLGQRAAQVAVRAIGAGDFSRQALLEYECLFLGPIQRGLDMEYRMITSLAQMTDGELDRICQTFSRINLAPFFFGEWRPMLTETGRWLLTSLPLILRNWKLLRRMMKG